MRFAAMMSIYVHESRCRLNRRTSKPLMMMLIIKIKGDDSSDLKCCSDFMTKSIHIFISNKCMWCTDSISTIQARRALYGVISIGRLPLLFRAEITLCSIWSQLLWRTLCRQGEEQKKIIMVGKVNRDESKPVLYISLCRKLNCSHSSDRSTFTNWCNLSYVTSFTWFRKLNLFAVWWNFLLY